MMRQMFARRKKVTQKKEKKRERENEELRPENLKTTTSTYTSPADIGNQ